MQTTRNSNELEKCRGKIGKLMFKMKFILSSY